MHIRRNRGTLRTNAPAPRAAKRLGTTDVAILAPKTRLDRAGILLLGRLHPFEYQLLHSGGGLREIDIAFGVSRDVMPRSENAGRLDRAHDLERLAINDGNAFVGTHIQELLSSVGGQRQIACKRRVGALANVLTPRKGRATSTFPTGLYR